MAIKKGTDTDMMGSAVTVVDEPSDNGAVSLSKSAIEQQRETYDLANSREAYKQEIIASGEIDRLTSTIDITNTTATTFAENTDCTISGKTFHKSISLAAVNPIPTDSDKAAIVIFLCVNPAFAII